MNRDEAREGGYVGWVRGMSVVGLAAGSWVLALNLPMNPLALSFIVLSSEKPLVSRTKGSRSKGLQ